MDVKLPPLGEGTDSGTVVNILVKEGDQVTKGQTIIELETGKAVAPIPSSADGKVSTIAVKEGSKISVGATILSLGDGCGPAAEPDRPAVAKSESAPEAPGDNEPGNNEAATTEEFSSNSPLPPPASPSLRRLARDLGIDLRKIKGSENGGRIVLADLRNYIQRLQKRATQAP